jgi:hypothetical protein
MKPGDIIQIAQNDGVQHWIYALVIQASEGGALVEVNHPGNREDGRQKFVPVGAFRTKAELQAQLDAFAKEAAAGKRDLTDPRVRAERESLLVQVERLS